MLTLHIDSFTLIFWLLDDKAVMER